MKSLLSSVSGLDDFVFVAFDLVGFFSKKTGKGRSCGLDGMSVQCFISV